MPDNDTTDQIVSAVLAKLLGSAAVQVAPAPPAPAPAPQQAPVALQPAPASPDSVPPEYSSLLEMSEDSQLRWIQDRVISTDSGSYENPYSAENSGHWRALEKQMQRAIRRSGARFDLKNGRLYVPPGGGRR